MTTSLTDRARKAAEEIAGEFYPQLRSLAGCNGVCEECGAVPKSECIKAEAAITAKINEIIEPNRVGIGEVYVEDGKRKILVDDGIERLSLDLPLTVYAWRELPTPPPNVAKETARCPQ